MFAMHFKRLWKNPVTLCMTVFIMAVVIVPMYIIGMNKVMKMDYISSMTMIGMMTVIPYLFFGFLLLSYELFYGWSKSQIQETIVGGTKNKLWDKGSCAMLLMCIDVITCLLTFGCCFKTCHDLDIHSKAFIIYQFRAIFIYQFLGCALAVVIGWAASHIQKRIWGITFILVIAYLFEGGFIRTTMAINLKSYSIWEFALLFCTFFSDARAMESANYFLTAENANLYRTLFWIFFFIVAGMIAGERKKIYTAVPAILTVAMLLLYMQPSGEVYVINAGGFDSWNYPYLYYGEGGWKREVDFEGYIGQSRDDFYIKEYAMQIKVDDIVKAKVSVIPDNTELSEYQFTLYHKYEIDRVTDSSGKPLEFKQESDYTTVYNPSGKIDEIIFEYSGCDQWYYATTQGMFLAANFQYYPKAGWKRIYLDYSMVLTMDEPKGFWCELPKEKAMFQVQLSTKGKYQVYSNIGQKGETVMKNGYTHHEFCGETDGVTLMGNPYLHEKEVFGVRMVYSDADAKFSPIGDVEKEYEKEFAKLEKNGCSMKGKTFFVYSINQYGTECMGEDQYIGTKYDVATRAENYKKYGIIYKKMSDEEIRKEQEELEAFRKEQEQLYKEESENE